MIYSNGPKPYIATLPDQNKERLVFEYIEPYIPVLGEIAVSGIPNVNITPLIRTVFAPVVATFAVTIPPNVTNASVFADI